MNPVFIKPPLMLEDMSQNVWKYVFYFQDAIAEAVLYKYQSFEERAVLCVSVQSGCPVGCAFCFIEDEKICTPNGEASIQELRIGDKVLSLNEETDQKRINEVVKTFKQYYDGELICIELENGRVLKATPDHPFYLKNGEIKVAKDLTDLDELKDFY